MLTPLLLQMLYIYKFRQLNRVFGPQGGDTILNELLNIVINHDNHIKGTSEHTRI